MPSWLELKMEEKEKLRLGWHAGSSAQIELFDPNPAAGRSVYQLKYTPPFRATIRRPVSQLRLGAGELKPIDTQLNNLATAPAPRAPNDANEPEENSESAVRKLEQLGKLLYSSVIPPYIQADLRNPGLFLELGLDESLLGYPWELMHDGDEFLCLKHFIGRFVNARTESPELIQPAVWAGIDLEELSILLIVVPRPQRQDIVYDTLPGAEAEANTIIETLDGVPGIKPIEILSGRDANFVNVSTALNRGGHHIIHFCGHATFEDEVPHLSSLVLQDENLTAGLLRNYILQKPPTPILCFVNGCETARPATGKAQFNVFGLARSFLETGAYLLGTRWKVNDDGASNFAGKFYSSFLKDGKPLGLAIREARVACKAASKKDDFAWASYTLYGDPRVLFRKAVN